MCGSLDKKEMEALKHELKKLPYLEKELKMWISELEKKPYDIPLQSPVWNGIKSANLSDKTADAAVLITDSKETITQLVYRIEKQKNKLIKFIDSIDDSLYRQIVYYRSVMGLEWNEVARNIGGDNSDLSIKKMYSRIFEKPYNFNILTEESHLQ